jgi:signal recognition particle subunit SRP54
MARLFGFDYKSPYFYMVTLKALKGVEVSDDAFKPIEAIISSMTPAERSNPSLLNGSRKNRIAKGSGTSIVEVNRFLKQFEQTSKMMKKMQQMQGLRRRKSTQHYSTQLLHQSHYDS